MKELIIIIALILLNGLFSMSETALISARKSRLREQSRKGNRAAATALRIAENPDQFLSTVQIGITLIGILTGLYSGATLADALVPCLQRLGLSAAVSHNVAQVSIIVIVTFLSIVVGELVPKRIALNSAESVSKLVAAPMKLLTRLSMPAVWVLSKSTAAIIKLLRLRDDENKTTEGDVKQIIESGAQSGEVQPVEKAIMNRTLMLGDQSVSSIMTSRKQIVALSIDMDADEIIERISSELHDSYPVMNEEGDNTIGAVSLKDLIFKLQEPGFKLADAVTPAIFIPETMTVYNALERLKAGKAHTLLVCDEFGVLQGLVTSNDILDGLVGSEGDSVTEPYIRPREDGSLLVEAQCPVYDFLAYCDMCDLYTPSNYSTLAGLILESVRRIPNEGDKIEWHNFTFEIIDMDNNRIDKLLVTRKEGE